MVPIAFGHKKRVGKDTARKFLMSHLRADGHKGSIQKGSFADGLKEQCFQLFKWAGMEKGDYYNYKDTEHLRDVPLNVIQKSPRQIWIEYGNKCREIYPEVWIDYLFSLHEFTDILLIADCRYPNEARRIKDYGGLVVKIENPRVTPTDDVADCAMDNFKDWDYIIVNDGSLDDLHQKIVRFANELI